MSTAVVILFWLIAIPLVFAYCRNIYRLWKDVESKNYKMTTAIRTIGVFFPVVGVFMGFISN